MTEKIMHVVNSMLNIKEERKKAVKLRCKYYRKYIAMLKHEKLMTKKLHEKLEEFEQFRVTK